MDGFYGERDMRSCVGNTDFLWKRSILHVISGTVGSGRIKGIKVSAILRTKRKGLDGAKRSLPSEARRSQAGTSRNVEACLNLNILGHPMPIEAWAVF